MKIGVLGGSFNPPTIAHAELSKACIFNGFCDKVLWVPVNDSYRKSTNIDSQHRVKMVELALWDEPDISFSLHELQYNRIVSTFESMQVLQSLHPHDELNFIAGADKLGFKWMQNENFISQFGYILLNRGDIDCESILTQTPTLSKYRNKIKLLDYTSDISSTQVREQIRDTGTSQLVDKKVLEYIISKNLFKEE